MRNRLAMTLGMTLGMMLGVMCMALITLAVTATTYAHAHTVASPEAPEVASINITPDGISLPAAQTQLFTATVTNNAGSVITTAVVTWTVAPGAGTLLTTGPLTALVQVSTSVGFRSNALAATRNDVTGTASYTITPGPAATIVVQPPVDTVTVGGTRTFAASGFDAYGNAIPSLNVTWSVSPSAGTIAASSATTMTLQASTTPGLYINAIKATSGAAAGTADVLLQVGPPATVIITPSVATLNINATQAFQARVYDKYGNLLNLGVTWLARGGTLQSATANSVVYRAGTVADTFVKGLTAANGQVQSTVPITIPAGPPSALRVVASPASIKTDGNDSSTIVASVVDSFGNPTGAGTNVAFSTAQCVGACRLTPPSGVANAQGQVSTTLRSTNTSPTQPLTSPITVSAQMQSGTASAGTTITVTGSFVPFRQYLAISPRTTAYTNHTSCMALTLTPPATITQPPDQLFNLYRFVATQSQYTFVMNDYATTGQLLLYRILADQCATDNPLSVVFVTSAPIASPNFQTTFDNVAFTPGAVYLLAVNTTGATSNQPYTIIVQP